MPGETTRTEWILAALASLPHQPVLGPWLWTRAHPDFVLLMGRNCDTVGRLTFHTPVQVCYAEMGKLHQFIPGAFGTN